MEPSEGLREWVYNDFGRVAGNSCVDQERGDGGGRSRAGGGIDAWTERFWGGGTDEEAVTGEGASTGEIIEILEHRRVRGLTIGLGGIEGLGVSPSNSISASVGRLIAEAEANGFLENSWSFPIGDGPGLLPS